MARKQTVNKHCKLYSVQLITLYDVHLQDCTCTVQDNPDQLFVWKVGGRALETQLVAFIAPPCPECAEFTVQNLNTKQFTIDSKEESIYRNTCRPRFGILANIHHLSRLIVRERWVLRSDLRSIVIAMTWLEFSWKILSESWLFSEPCVLGGAIPISHPR